MHCMTATVSPVQFKQVTIVVVVVVVVNLSLIKLNLRTLQRKNNNTIIQNIK